MSRIVLVMNGIRINSLDDLRKNFNPEYMLSFYRSGRLQKWLEDCGAKDELAIINEFEKGSDDATNLTNLMKVFELSEEQKANVEKQMASIEKQNNSAEKTNNSAEKQIDSFNAPDSTSGTDEKKYTLRITTACVGCTKCMRNCPVGAISGVVKQKHVIDTAKCIRCDKCYDGCPVHAVVIDDWQGDDKNTWHNDEFNKLCAAVSSTAVSIGSSCRRLLESIYGESIFGANDTGKTLNHEDTSIERHHTWSVCQLPKNVYLANCNYHVTVSSQLISSEELSSNDVLAGARQSLYFDQSFFFDGFFRASVTRLNEEVWLKSADGVEWKKDELLCNSKKVNANRYKQNYSRQKLKECGIDTNRILDIVFDGKCYYAVCNGEEGGFCVIYSSETGDYWEKMQDIRFSKLDNVFLPVRNGDIVAAAGNGILLLFNGSASGKYLMYRA